MKYILYIVSFLFSNLLVSQICVGTQGSVQWECWQNLMDDQLGELYAEENYPHTPDVTQTIFKLQSPTNFDNIMGARISGFISVPVSDSVTFNLTGDDITRFYLSSDTLPENLNLESYADGWSSENDHDKYVTQTSRVIWLEANQYYYFELIYVEGGGGDHIQLYWKTENDDPDNWRLINSNFIFDVGCKPAACPVRGTSCDDGDATTTNDLEDGFCNCIGQKQTTNSCIGERAHLKYYAFDTIPGNNLGDLYADVDFPALPNRSKRLNYMAEPWSNSVDSVGHLVQAFLSVPVTGNYKFNITGNNDCIFFLSSDETEENKQSHQIIVVGSTDPVEHDKYIFQSTSNIYLEKNKYYYVELNHKEGGYSEHFSVFWQTPFTQDDTWKRVPDFYFYNYDCEIACIPQGVACDDGDPFTNNDMYNGNCECTGTPCSGPDCNDPVASYSPFPDCGITSQLDNRQDNNWLSCELTANPNPSRPNSHWIRYDFGEVFKMWNSHIWNYNATSGSNQGFQNAAIDYSIDGVNWNSLGTFTWPLANGSNEYGGFIGPSFEGKNARYVLITSLDNPNGVPCRGFGKITINAQRCLNFGQACDDENPYTINDQINEDCVCQGEIINDCANQTLSLGDTTIVMGQYSAAVSIDSENLINGPVMYVAGQEIDLDGGFEVVLGSNFEALIEQCNETSDEEEEELLKNLDKEIPLIVSQIPDSDRQNIQFVVDKEREVAIEIYNTSGKKLFTLINTTFKNKGIYKKGLRTFKLDPGVYQVVYKRDKEKYTERMSVI